MSLEGLDSEALTNAFEAAASEPGGWFWLKYTTRDEVELLTSGSNGAEGMRLAAYTQPDDSPLYGFIKFRRRAVLVKYVPEGTSRVVKARSQVHFALVAERFSPHDTTHVISTPKELTDTGLNSSCSTHAATASISSSNSSVRQRRLADIAESADEEEESAVLVAAVRSRANLLSVTSHPRDFSPSSFHSHTSSSFADGVSGRGDFEGEARDTTGRDPGGSGPANNDPVAFLSTDKGDTTTAPPQHHPPPPDGDLYPPSRKSSSSSSRLDLSGDIYNYYPYVPKVKLGPRPHVADSHQHHHHRPHHHSSTDRSKSHASSSSLPLASSQAHTEELRASIPKSVHALGKRNVLPSRSSSLAATLELPQPPAPPRTPTTPTSIVSLPTFPTSPASISSARSAETAAIPPEKARLMKALQLRRQKAMAMEQKEQDTVGGASGVMPDARTPTQADMPGGMKEQEAGNGAGKLDGGNGQVGGKREGEQAADKRDTIKAPIHTYIANDNTSVQLKETSHDEESLADETDATSEEPVIEALPVPGALGPTPIISVKDFEEALEKKMLAEKANEEARDQRPSTAATEASITTDTDTEKAEGTKVRDDVLDSESDAESARSMDVSINESRPVTMICSDTSSMPPPPLPIPAISRAYHQPTTISIDPTKRPATSAGIEQHQVPVAPAVPSKAQSLRRVDCSISSSEPESADTIIETARSVSAPFLKSARVQHNDSKPAIVKKVNVGMGSVSQRIKQFQQLATAPKKSYTPPARTPSRSNSPTPEWALANRVSMLNQTSPTLPGAPTIRKSSFVNVGPPIKRPEPSPTTLSDKEKPEHSSRVEIVEKDSRTQLQVTTKIQQTPDPQPLSAASLRTRGSPLLDSMESPATSTIPTLRRKSVDLNAVVDMMSRRSSMDQSSIRSGTGTIVDKSDKPRLFSRPSNKDLTNTTSGTENDIAGRPKRSPSFLKRVGSSLSRRKDGAGTESVGAQQESVYPSPAASPVPVAPAVPAEPRKKEWLLSGWLNVQLPDTMLWRQRYIKVEDAGYMFLGLSKDENNPPARRFHLPTEVRKIDTPDVDEQELPFSVRVILNEGGMIQCACMNSKEQKEVLAVLRKAASAV
ncbi:hypothetical protein EX30DRAFT_367960 [Ascodesmis nigricans]|uniref:ADF-H domain-containing protein n=1 Tax=Ascodesmis nigricans TaxID=341454 RepID=A0A4S2N6C6_9PEZI|nr:hypothetical protein EX30DRAFT_367960 [Ascodesmis nigricans]